MSTGDSMEKDLLSSSSTQRQASRVHPCQDKVALYYRRLAHDALHVWCEGLRAIHQLQNLQSLQSWHPTQEGTQQGLWAIKTNPNRVLTFRALNFFKYLYFLLLLQKNSLEETFLRVIWLSERRKLVELQNTSTEWLAFRVRKIILYKGKEPHNRRNTEGGKQYSYRGQGLRHHLILHERQCFLHWEVCKDRFPLCSILSLATVPWVSSNRWEQD